MAARFASDTPLVWDTSPIIFSVGPVPVRWYGVLFATGFLLGFLIIKKVFERESKPATDLDSLLIVMIISTIVGARLGHCLFYHPQFYLSNPLRLLEIYKGGLASHGAGIGILTGIWIYSRKRPEQPFLWVLDRVAIPIALAGCLIRIGNLFNSEIIGIETTVPWAIVFERIDSVPRHPAQLYESLCYGTIFLVLFTLYRKRGATIAPGLLSGIFFTFVFTARFLIEFVKRRQADYAADMPLRVGQMLSIVPVLFGIGLLAYAWRHRGSASAAREPGTADPKGIERTNSKGKTNSKGT